jgi:hypothetical protein
MAGGDLQGFRPTTRMDPFVLLVRSDGGRALANPTTIGLAWRLEEVERLGPEAEEFEPERNLYARGYRWCDCFSCFTPDGEGGHLPAENLLAVSQAEFEFAHAAIASGPDAFNRAVAALAYGVPAVPASVPSRWLPPRAPEASARWRGRRPGSA